MPQPTSRITAQPSGTDFLVRQSNLVIAGEVDEDANNTGRVVAFNSDGLAIQPGSFTGTGETMAIRVSDSDSANFDGGSLLVEISAGRRGVSEVGGDALFIKTDTAVFSVDGSGVVRWRQDTRISGDDEMRSELFICGVFSLLDRMFHQPFSELLKTIPVPERVYQVLSDGSGPYAAYLNLVKAMEGQTLDDIREAAEALFMTFGDINRCVLKAMANATQLD